MTDFRKRFIVIPLLTISGIAYAQSSESERASDCTALQTANFSGVVDAPTQITEAKAIESSEGTPAYCRVQGYVSPQVGFEIRLPTSGWNGKFMATGCGGACGSIPIEWLCPEPLQRGYACIASDMGHKDAKGGGLWAFNNLQAEIDWGCRATHVTALAGKAITAQYYDQAPRRSYFMGCSTGGRQGMVAAQRFPWDFDGIIAGAPASDQSGAIMTRLWAALAIRGEDGKPVGPRLCRSSTRAHRSRREMRYE